MNKDKNFEIKYPHYCIEITLRNDDILMFSFLNSQKYGACLLVEDTPYMECSTPDEVIANTGEEERLKELVILEECISTVDVNEQRKNIPIKIKNDAKCAALAENKYGSLKDYKRSIFIGLGTGIGGAVIVDDKLLDTGDLPGCEIGHMIIQKDGLECKCGKKGCFEKYASMKAFKKIGRAHV